MWSRFGTWFRKRPLVCYGLPPLAWMLLIYAISAQSTLPHASNNLVDVLLKKVAHITGYAVLLVLWWKAFAVRLCRVSSLGAAWGMTVLYAMSDEFHQTFVPGRKGRPLDVIVDACGAAFAVVGLWLFTRSQ